MNVEVDTHVNGIDVGFSYITFTGCYLYAADYQTLDFSSGPGSGQASYITVENCTIEGGGVTKVAMGYGLCLEMPLHAVITGNHFTRAYMQALNITPRSETTFTGPATQMTNNTFDLTTGTPSSGDPPIVLKGGDNVFTGNTITGYTSNSAIVAMWNTTNNTVNNNTFRSIGGKTPVVVYSDSGNTLAPNVVQ